MSHRVTAAALVAVTAGLAALVRSCELVQVRGVSMAPTLLPGDRLLVVAARVRRPRRGAAVGDVVVLPDPRGGRDLVKRVGRSGAAGVHLVGDNPAASTDSRVFGAVERRRVRGVAVYRYHPPERAGWLLRRPSPGAPSPSP